MVLFHRSGGFPLRVISLGAVGWGSGRIPDLFGRRILRKRAEDCETPELLVSRRGQEKELEVRLADWQGAQQLKQEKRDDLASIFILPPSTKELEQRLRSRAQDSDKVVAQRMSKAVDEISHWPEYDYVVVNHEIEEALAQVRAILIAERLKRMRQTYLVNFVKRLQDGQ